MVPEVVTDEKIESSSQLRDDKTRMNKNALDDKKV